MTDDQDQHKHTLSFLKSVLSCSKPQLSFQKIETPRILLSIAVNFGCSSCNAARWGWGGVGWDVNVHVTLMMLRCSLGLGWGGVGC